MTAGSCGAIGSLRRAACSLAVFLAVLTLLTMLQAPVAALPGEAGSMTTPAAADSFDLRGYHGKVVYLDFWASWCAPCRHSFPWMRSMQERYGPQGFQVVAVDLDRDPKAAAAFLTKYGPPFPIINDPGGKMAVAYDIEAMPTSIVYDRLGKPRAVHLGFRESDTEKIEAEIRELLAESFPDSTEG